MMEKEAQLIALEILRVLKSRFDNSLEDAESNRNAPFHKAVLNTFSNKLEKHIDNESYCNRLWNP
ncbi:hypothetical protein CLV27_0286 [Phorcysia thermohydrogeniphila]|uniref:Uncharacterized protein n=1 Tax=Phorcysia thermohydrogeniphila TaxID=936138 RepID=A0A4R1GI21_9BACT|nr:hypothetical protein CLV27_0286 [Phorcysia thermohydrogeniphila]